MRKFLTLSACALLGLSAHDAPASELFNGRDLSGWELVATPTTNPSDACTFLPEGVIAMTGQPIGFLATTANHGNYRLHAEWRWPAKPGNGGVLLHISSGPKDRAWPLSIQVQTKNKNAGDLLPMAGASFSEPLTTAAGAATAIKARTGADSEKPVGEWNSCDIECKGDTIEVTINGVLQNKITQVSPHSGKVGFQFEGTPFEVRNVVLSPLN